MKFSESQQMAIDYEGKNLLVSAAAGSGKTAVLVERIFQLMMGRPDEHGNATTMPKRIDRFLIVTFTNAAAAQMREKISERIEQALEKADLSKELRLHLEEQAVLVHHARISTIHSFCMGIIKENFTKINLDPAFRMGDEIQMKLLESDCMEQAIENAYGGARKKDEGFYEFIENVCMGKNDKKLSELLLKVYHGAVSAPVPEVWLSNITREWTVGGLLEEAFSQTEGVIRAVEQTVDSMIALCDSPNGPKAYRSALDGDLRYVRNIKELIESEKSGGDIEDVYEKIAATMNGYQHETLGRVTKKDTVDEEKKELVKNVRELVKKELKNLKENIFSRSIHEIEEEEAYISRMVGQMVRIVLDFMTIFKKEKEDARILDFNDLEHFALKILTVEHRDEAGAVSLEPSDVAKEYQKLFEEIMIDEYQDSNEIQEILLKSVSKDNFFMVGDVKQSIYKFRMAKPEIFEWKHRNYKKITDMEPAGEGCLVELSNNYRSRNHVLDFVNLVFESAMEKKVGNVDYDEDARLYYEGREFRPYPEGAAVRTECFIGSCEAGADSQEVEAHLVAKRIKKMLADKELIFDDEIQEFRPVRKKDIVILFRAMSGWSEKFMQILRQEGIDACCDTNSGFFQTDEVTTMLQLLRVLDNPRQDIPVVAVMLSPIFCFEEQELAMLRENLRDFSWYHVVEEYRSSGKDAALREKVQKMSDKIKEWRRKKNELSLGELLEYLLEDSGYQEKMASLAGGTLREANLKMLVQKALDFESTGKTGIFQFLRYIEKLNRYEVDFGEAEAGKDYSDSVTIMSIHKSKGLEFPVVFVSSMEKGFNRMEQNSTILVHPEYGVAMDCLDGSRRLKKTSLRKKLLQNKFMTEGSGEEIRILYVAMTRAKEKLVLTGCVSNLSKKKQAWQLQMNNMELVEEGKQKRWVMSAYDRSSAENYFSFVMPALLRHENNDGKYNLDEINEIKNGLFSVKFCEYAEIVNLEVIEQVEEKKIKEFLDKKFSSDLIEGFEENELVKSYLTYEYPYESMEDKKGKVSVTELKKAYCSEVLSKEEDYQPSVLFMDEEGIIREQSTVEELGAAEERKEPLPKFRLGKEEFTGAERGTLYHFVMEKLDYKTVEPSKESIELFLRNMEELHFLRKEEREQISVDKIKNFLEGGLGARMRKAALSGSLYREAPFVMGMKAFEVYQGVKSDETILVQGIIDAYFEEDGELILVDYKTDRVRQSEKLREKYQIQVKFYKEALERATGKKVSQILLYSFHLGEEVEVFV